MRGKRKTAIEIFSLVLILVLLISVVNFFMVTKDENYQRWSGFLRLNKNTLDLVFIGNSHSVYSYIPMIFDEKLGIDSYNMCTQGGTIQQNYYQLKEIFKTQSPKMVVLEMYSISITDLVDVYQPYRVHAAFDRMPFSKNKVDAINHNANDNSSLDYMLPMSVYHLKWKEESLSQDIAEYMRTDFSDSPYNGYGIINSNLIRSFDTSELIISSEVITDEKTEISQESMDMLQDFISLCKEHNAKLLIVSSPYIAQDGATYAHEYSVMNYIRPYLQEQDVPLFDYAEVQEELGLNATQMYNDGHLNYIGATNVSNYFAGYLSDNYSNVFADCLWDNKEISQEKMENLVNSQSEFVKEYNQAIQKTN